MENIYNHPEKPSLSDCCGTGCVPCVFDIYEQHLQKFKDKNNDTTSVSNFRYDLLSPITYKPFKILNILPFTSNTYSYRFQPLVYGTNISSENACIEGILPYKSGQHVIITTYNFGGLEKMCNSKETSSSYSQIRSRNIDTTTSRDYTPISVAKKQNNCVVDILIKLYPGGKMSNFLSNLICGDVVYIRGPFGDYHYESNKYKVIYMICAGTGIAPMYGLIQIIIENENDETVVQFCYACHTVHDILLRSELRQYSQYWNFIPSIYLSDGLSNSNLDIYYGENIICGRISLLTIEGLIKDKEHCFVLICGTESFNDDVHCFVQRCGVSSNQIHIFK